MSTDIHHHHDHEGQPAVAHLAHQLWEEHGRPAGRDLEFWLTAESRLRGHSLGSTDAFAEPPHPESSRPVTRSSVRSPDSRPIAPAPGKTQARHRASSRRG